MPDQGKKGWLRVAIVLGREAHAGWPHWEDGRPRRALEAAERWLDGRLDAAACAEAAGAALACADELLHACGVTPAVAEVWRGPGRVARMCALVASAAATLDDDVAADLVRELAALDEDRHTDPAARAAAGARAQAIIRRFTTRPVCGCHFTAGASRVPGSCWGRPFAPGQMCTRCDDSWVHRHCMSCGAYLIDRSCLGEVRCAVCPPINLA